jgi:predicted transcriptional regulator
MCSILLPINPVHVENIFNGSKRYEYRKTRCKRNTVTKIIIYSTAPVMKVVGEVLIDEIIEDEPSTVWKITREFAGISKCFFDKYYHGNKKAIAYKLGKIKEYKKPLTLENLGIHYVPQSFIYID